MQFAAHTTSTITYTFSRQQNHGRQKSRTSHHIWWRSVLLSEYNSLKDSAIQPERLNRAFPRTVNQKPAKLPRENPIYFLTSFIYIGEPVNVPLPSYQRTKNKNK